MPVVTLIIRIGHVSGPLLKDMEDEIIDAYIDEMPGEFYFDDTEFSIDIDRTTPI